MAVYNSGGHDKQVPQWDSILSNKTFSYQKKQRVMSNFKLEAGAEDSVFVAINGRFPKYAISNNCQ